MTTKKGRYYFEGVFYDGEDEFLRAAAHYENSMISSVSVERTLLEMCQYIRLNLTLKGTKMTNHDLGAVCDKTIDYFLMQFKAVNDGVVLRSLSEL